MTPQPEKAKTLEDFKHEVAQKIGFNAWRDVMYSPMNISRVLELSDLANEQYRVSLIKQPDKSIDERAGEIYPISMIPCQILGQKDYNEPFRSAYLRAATTQDPISQEIGRKKERERVIELCRVRLLELFEPDRSIFVSDQIKGGVIEIERLIKSIKGRG